MKWVVEHVGDGYQIFDLMGCVIPCDSRDHAEFMANWFTEHNVSGKGEIDYDITNATLYFHAQNSDIRRGRRVSDEEAQDRYDEAMRYLDNQKN